MNAVRQTCQGSEGPLGHDAGGQHTGPLGRPSQPEHLDGVPPPPSAAGPGSAPGAHRTGGRRRVPTQAGAGRHVPVRGRLRHAQHRGTPTRRCPRELLQCSRSRSAKRSAMHGAADPSSPDRTGPLPSATARATRRRSRRTGSRAPPPTSSGRPGSGTRRTRVGSESAGSSPARPATRPPRPGHTSQHQRGRAVHDRGVHDLADPRAGGSSVPTYVSPRVTRRTEALAPGQSRAVRRSHSRIVVCHEATARGSPVVGRRDRGRRARLMLPMYDWPRWASGGRAGTNLLDSGRPWYDVYRTRTAAGCRWGRREPVLRDLLRVARAVAEGSGDRSDPASWGRCAVHRGPLRRARPRSTGEALRGHRRVRGPGLSMAEAPAHRHMGPAQLRVGDTGAGPPVRWAPGRDPGRRRGRGSTRRGARRLAAGDRVGPVAGRRVVAQWPSLLTLCLTRHLLLTMSVSRC